MVVLGKTVEELSLENSLAFDEAIAYGRSLKNAKNSDIPRTAPCGRRAVLYFFSFCLKEPAVFGYTGKLKSIDGVI
jgi:hypothetical protein